MQRVHVREFLYAPVMLFALDAAVAAKLGVRVSDGVADPQHARFKTGLEPIILGVSQPNFR